MTFNVFLLSAAEVAGGAAEAEAEAAAAVDVDVDFCNFSAAALSAFC